MSSRVREALFSMVGQQLDGITVLDAFGGSGLLGFEAASRGATLTTVERNRSAARQIGETAAQFGIEIDLRVVDVNTVFGTAEWDLVLLDPPYADDPLRWAERASASVGSVLVIAHRSGASWPDVLGALALDRSRRHGDSTLTIYRRGDNAGEEESSVVLDDLGVVEDDR